jgi:uncharacterized membrane protein YozB (DUF420 family)
VLTVLTAENVLLALKVAVSAVTVLLVASLLALARGNYRLHGRINTVFFVLTLTALVSLEIVVRMLRPDIFDAYFADPGLRTAFTVHLAFSLPAALLLLAMLYTGWKGRRNLHLGLGVVFLVLWAGTFVTGLFFLPQPVLP